MPVTYSDPRNCDIDIGPSQSFKTVNHEFFRRCLIPKAIREPNAENEGTSYPWRAALPGGDDDGGVAQQLVV